MSDNVTTATPSFTEALKRNPYAGFDVGSKAMVYSDDCLIPLALLSLEPNGSFDSKSVERITSEYAAVMQAMRTNYSRLFVSSGSVQYYDRNDFAPISLTSLNLSSLTQYLIAQYVCEMINIRYTEPYCEIISLSYPRSAADFCKFTIAMSFCILDQGLQVDKNAEISVLKHESQLKTLAAPLKKDGTISFNAATMVSFLRPLITFLYKLFEQTRFLTGALGQYVGTVLASQLDERYLPPGTPKVVPGVPGTLDWSYCMHAIAQKFVELSATSSPGALSQDRVIYDAMKSFLFPKAYFSKVMISCGPKHSVFIVPPAIPIPVICDRAKVQHGTSSNSISIWMAMTSSGSGFVTKAASELLNSLKNVAPKIFNRLTATITNGSIVVRDLCNGDIRYIADNSSAFFDALDPVALKLDVRIEPQFQNILGSIGIKSYRDKSALTPTLDIYTTTYAPEMIKAPVMPTTPYSYFARSSADMGYPFNCSERCPDMFIFSPDHALGAMTNIAFKDLRLVRSELFANNVFGTTEATMPYIVRDARIYANYLGWILQNMELAELCDFIELFDLTDMRQMNTMFYTPEFNTTSAAIADHALRLQVAYIGYALALYGSTYRAAFFELVCKNFTFLLEDLLKRGKASKAYTIQRWD